MENLNEAIAAPRLRLFDAIPEYLPDIPVDNLDSILPGPSLIHIKGKVAPPLFISVLLHGNETTSFLAMQHLIRELNLASRPAPREIVLFIGNIPAAAKGVRMLEKEPDYNRIWDGGSLPEHRLAQEVLQHVSRLKPFAAVDIHNNSGKNPHYACINRTDESFLNLARRFSKTIVYFTEPHEVISMALSSQCPSVTLECGLTGEAGGLSHVCNYLVQCLTLPVEELFSPPTNKHNDIYHTIAKITVPDGSHLGFGRCEENTDICFREDMEELNFTEVPSGTTLGVSGKNGLCLKVTDNSDKEITKDYFRLDSNEIVTRKPLIPSMFTKNETIIHQDCFGYIMEHYPIEK
ncbi:MAG: M14 family metallopeptidase [Chlorobiales bacterium]|nr:M14 family metallopeptidase [Chlorobiales bacterium]